MGTISQFAELYMNALKDLTTPDMQKIKLMRDLARENLGEAPNIVAAVERHLKNCPASHRLPALYLADCIMKSVGQPYQGLFTPVISQLFSFVWDGTPELRPKLTKLAGTWKDLLPVNVLSTIESKISPPTVVQQPTVVVMPGQQSLGSILPHGAVAMLPAGAQAPISAYPAAVQQPIYLTAPSAAGVAQGVTYAYVQPPAGAAPAQPPTWVLPAPTAAPTSTGAVAAPSVAGISAPQQLPDLAASLLSLSKHLAGVPSTAGQGSSGGAAGSRDGSGGGAALGPLTSQGLKDFNQAAVDALMRASDSTRGKFLDQQYHRNRRLQNTTHPVRPWYTNVDQWLQGTRTDIEAAADGFFEEDKGKEGTGGPAEPQLHLVEEDPAQPTCAISGEAFERTYDPDTDKWYYEDAVVLSGEQAAQYGVMEGSIVKVQCLAGPDSAGLAMLAAPKRGRDDVTPALIAATAAGDAAGSAQNGAAGSAAGAGQAAKRHRVSP